MGTESQPYLSIYWQLITTQRNRVIFYKAVCSVDHPPVKVLHPRCRWAVQNRSQIRENREGVMDMGEVGGTIYIVQKCQRTNQNENKKEIGTGNKNEGSQMCSKYQFNTFILKHVQMKV